jgi:Glycosyltransferase family 87
LVEEDERSPARYRPLTVTHVVRSELGLARGLPARLRDPRRIATIVLLALAAGLVLAFIWARGQLAGSDALAYWTGVHRWLSGEDIYQVLPGLYIPPTEGALPYAYAPWSLYVFLPWALLPWDVAWVLWRVVNVALFAWSVAWAYDRRPLGTAVIVATLAPSLAANLDTGNVNLLISLSPWLAWLVSARWGGIGWAVGTALKFLPAPLLLFMPRPSWRVGLGVLAVLAVLTLATWPQTLRQLDIVLNYPRPLRVDYMILAWGIVPWLWLRDWPPRLTREWLAGVKSQVAG